jgi:hypothetical protein
VSAPLRILNIALALVGGLLAAALTRELVAAHPLPSPPLPRATRAVATAPPPSASAPPSTVGYGVIATKNLFSASRSETAAGPVAAVGPKPVLHGVVLDGPKSRAYLEDPLVKRTFGYAVGDTLGGGRVESIAADRVVIGRGDGSVEVLLRDPSKPRPTPPAPGPAGAPPAGAAPSGTATTPSATPPTNEPAPAPAPRGPGFGPRAER